MNERSHDHPHVNRIEPASFQRPPLAPHRRRHVRVVPLLVTGLLALFAVGAWFVFGTQAVQLEITPEPDVVTIEGGLSLPLAGRYLLRPGRYTVVAEKSGYQRLTAPIEVTAADDNPVFSFELTERPGRLTVRSQPAEATVLIDGEEVGRTPLTSVPVAAGEHAVTVRAMGYQVYHTDLAIEGKDVLQTLEVDLEPASAPVTFRSQPSGASVLVDGDVRGTTPLTTELAAGSRQVRLRLKGHEPWERTVDVVAGQAQELPVVRLAPASARLRITSDPDGANVTVADEFRGRTPVTIALPPEQVTTIRLAKAGYQPATREMHLASGEEKALSLTLEPILGSVEVRATPADATLYVDGEARGAANQTLSLPAVPHVIEVRKTAYADFRTEVTPKPGFTQQVQVELETKAEARGGAVPPMIETAAGQLLKLIQPGRFTMGAPRREQGRRANETQYPVELTRPFYIGVREVTNAEFRQFQSSHSSGIVQRVSLDNDNYPVVRVSWEDAARYCNWLSERDGLPPAYREGPQGMELVTPPNTGYRLPTEAEWEWAARFAGGRTLKYPWGQSMPPAGKVGNYADRSAAELFPQHLESYDDGYPATAPAARFNANALGLYDLGGNVSEWVHDRYSIGPQSTTETVRDPLGPERGSARTVRGSSWRHGRITELRLSYRDSATGPRDDLGFRLARYVE